MSESMPRPEPATSLSAVPGTEGLIALVGDKLTLVEDTLRSNLRSDFEAIEVSGRYVFGSGGKRIRPILVLLTSGLLGYEGDEDVQMASVFEFIHTATLVHDDIIDDADTRRGRASANQVFGNESTVLFGDYLYIHAMNMALSLGKLRLIEVLAEATEKLIEGEIFGANLRGRAGISPEQHMEIVERKTAWLFSACCRVSGVIAGLDRAEEDRLASYGMDLGIAFQLVDDLLDLTSDEETVGKPVASDLREGRMTLPWIDLYERGDDNDRASIRRVLEDRSLERVDFNRLRENLERRGCLERTMRLAREHADRARETMSRYPSSPFRDWLLEFPRTVIERDR